MFSIIAVLHLSVLLFYHIILLIQLWFCSKLILICSMFRIANIEQIYPYISSLSSSSSSSVSSSRERSSSFLFKRLFNRLSPDKMSIIKLAGLFYRSVKRHLAGIYNDASGTKLLVKKHRSRNKQKRDVFI